MENRLNTPIGPLIEEAIAELRRIRASRRLDPQSSAKESPNIIYDELAILLQLMKLETVPQSPTDGRTEWTSTAASLDDEHIPDAKVGNHELPGDPEESQLISKVERWLTSTLKESYITRIMATVGIKTEWAESPARISGNSQQSLLPSSSCIACGETNGVVRAGIFPCGHDYCNSCLEAFLKIAMKDESSLPPRCCRQAIDMNVAGRYLRPDILQQYKRKEVEFNPNSIPCFHAACSALIHPSHVKDEVAKCPDCERTTCTNCKGRAHKGDCARDPAMLDFLKTAYRNEWQRCYRCRRMVERVHGCSHIVCRCGAEFCYACGKEWNTCRRSQFNWCIQQRPSFASWRDRILREDEDKSNDR